MRSVFTILCLFFTIAGFGQHIAGNWEGNLQIQGTELPIIFHIIKDSTGKYQATFDSPKQKAYNLACSDVLFKEDSVIIMIQMLKGRYAGKLEENKKQLTGTWSQGPAALPLTLKKTGDVVTTKIINRPQTPRPPFPYKSEDVEYDNADRSIHFGATFTAPLPDPNINYFRAPIYPTVILITGSGKQDRDETIMGHKSFAVIADYLTRQGIAVLRVDDRDMGKTTGNYNNSTSADFAKDIEAGIAYLKSRGDVDTGNIGLIGHSEGGLIAPMVAVKTREVKFIVLLAGPGEKISTLMEQQAVDVAAASGVSKKYLEKYRLLYRQLVSTIVHEPDTAKALVKSVAVFDNWQKDKDIFLVKATTGVTNEKSKVDFVNQFVQQLSNRWFSYFLKFDPADYLERVTCPVLAINGEKDIQVSASPNLDAIKNALVKAGNTNFKTIAMPGLNHLFQHCKKCTVEEYNELEETFDTETLKLIGNWIKTDRFK
ncbi:MAG: alpha/beta fold hydrolase [Ferruginibacter sp.]